MCAAQLCVCPLGPYFCALSGTPRRRTVADAREQARQMESDAREAEIALLLAGSPNQKDLEDVRAKAAQFDKQAKQLADVQAQLAKALQERDALRVQLNTVRAPPHPLLRGGDATWWEERVRGAPEFTCHSLHWR
jgi:hypothetical protein